MSEPRRDDESPLDYTRRVLGEAKLAVPYLSLFPALREAARSCGYALAIHGSMARDFDLIAVPWTDEASDMATLVEAIRQAGALYLHPTEGVKPHGRRAFTLYPGSEGFIDLSIMPRAASTLESGTPEANHA